MRSCRDPRAGSLTERRRLGHLASRSQRAPCLMPSRHPTRARWKEVSFGLKEFQHAYLTGNFVAERLSWGLYQGDELVGVAVFGVPGHEAVLTNVFPDLEPSLNCGHLSIHWYRFRPRNPVGPPRP